MSNFLLINRRHKFRNTLSLTFNLWGVFCFRQRIEIVLPFWLNRKILIVSQILSYLQCWRRIYWFKCLKALYCIWVFLAFFLQFSIFGSLRPNFEILVPLLLLLVYHWTWSLNSWCILSLYCIVNFNHGIISMSFKILLEQGFIIFLSEFKCLV